MGCCVFLGIVYRPARLGIFRASQMVTECYRWIARNDSFARPFASSPRCPHRVCRGANVRLHTRQAFAIITFEAKTANAINVQAVYEALNHRAAATQSYVILHVPPDRAPGLEREVAHVAKAARDNGIGLLQVGDPGDYHPAPADGTTGEPLPLQPTFIAATLMRSCLCACCRSAENCFDKLSRAGEIRQYYLGPRPP